MKTVNLACAAALLVSLMLVSSKLGVAKAMSETPECVLAVYDARHAMLLERLFRTYECVHRRAAFNSSHSRAPAPLAPAQAAKRCFACKSSARACTSAHVELVACFVRTDSRQRDCVVATAALRVRSRAGEGISLPALATLLRALFELW